MTSATFHTLYNTPLGLVYIEGNNQYIMRIRTVPTNDYAYYVKGTRRDNHPLLREAKHALEEYFYYQTKSFDLPLSLAGSDFDKQVWESLQNIPYGHLATYGDVAASVGKPRAARAVGSACRRNPIWLIVPCHRVIGSDKKLRGYAGGLDKKQWLINHEECMLKREIVAEGKYNLSSAT